MISGSIRFSVATIHSAPAPVDSSGVTLTRPGFVRLRYRGLDNKEATPTIAGDYAALLAHEIHYLNGVFYIDYV